MSCTNCGQSQTSAVTIIYEGVELTCINVPCGMTIEGALAAINQAVCDLQQAVATVGGASGTYTLASPGGNQLQLLEGGNIVSVVDLSPYLDNVNLNALSLSPTTNVLTATLTDSNTVTVDLSNLVGIQAISAGANVSITGAGSNADPLVISSTNTVADGSETIINQGTNITITGLGTAADPYIINSAGGGGANLGYTAASNQGTVTSDSGTDAVIPLATSANAGLIPRYETGVFTPLLIDSGGGATYAPVDANGSYTRIGNVVTFKLRINDVTSTGTPTGILQVDGLPYNNTANGRSPVNVTVVNLGVNFTILTAYIANGTNIIDFLVKSGNTFDSTGTGVGAQSYTGTLELEISGTYLTT